MQIPQGYAVKGQNTVLKLKRSLYGLKQASRCWNEKFVKFLSEFNFKNIESDKCVFVGKVLNYKVFLALYVDDGLVISESARAVEEVLNYLKLHFKITHDVANEYVGMEIQRDRKNCMLKISQAGYIRKLLEKFNMLEAKPVSTPAEPGLYLNKSESKNDLVNLPYREAIGSLLFLSRVSRPDIEYAVNYLSQFLDSYNQEHWRAVKRIFRYLIGTIDVGLVYGNSGSSAGSANFGESSAQLVGYTDADYAGCLSTRRSRSGYVFLFNGTPISWSSQRQEVVALSTAEAEYIALFQGTKESVWLRRMMNELGLKQNCVPIFVDNQAAIKLANSNEHHKRTKHMDVRFHYIRGVAKRKEISIFYVNTKLQLADILTKPLTKLPFANLRRMLNIVEFK